MARADVEMLCSVPMMKTHVLATDMVAANVMGFAPHEVPIFTRAIQSGMGPSGIDKIEIRGVSIKNVRQAFVKPHIVQWTDINKSWGV